MITYIVDGSSVTVFLTEYRKFGPEKQILVFQAAETEVIFIILNIKFMIGKALGALMLSGGGSHEVWWF